MSFLAVEVDTVIAIRLVLDNIIKRIYQLLLFLIGIGSPCVEIGFDRVSSVVLEAGVEYRGNFVYE